MKRFLIAEKIVFVLIASMAFTFNAPGSSFAASNKDKALSLAASGCLGGMIDTPIHPKNISFLVISTASSSQWNDATNNDLVQIHHAHLLEGGVWLQIWTVSGPNYPILTSQYMTLLGEKLRGDSLLVIFGILLDESMAELLAQTVKLP